MNGKKFPIQAEHAQFPFFVAFGKSLKVSMFSITTAVLSHGNTSQWYFTDPAVSHWSAFSYSFEGRTDLEFVSASPLPVNNNNLIHTHTHTDASIHNKHVFG